MLSITMIAIVSGLALSFVGFWFGSQTAPQGKLTLTQLRADLAATQRALLDSEQARQQLRERHDSAQRRLEQAGSAISDHQTDRAALTVATERAQSLADELAAVRRDRAGQTARLSVEQARAAKLTQQLAHAAEQLREEEARGASLRAALADRSRYAEELVEALGKRSPTHHVWDAAGTECLLCGARRRELRKGHYQYAAAMHDHGDWPYLSAPECKR
jgi:DNA repair exonuclease SbcCD ATPase subunit